MKHIYILIVLLLFLSCKKNVNPNEAIVILKKDSIEQKENKKKLHAESNSRLKEKDFLNKSSQNKRYPAELFNTKLVGLGIKDSTAVNPYKRYWIDFNAYCYSPAISFYIDTQKNKIYAVRYDFENTSIADDTILFQFNIEKIVKDKSSYKIFLNEVEQFILENHYKVEEIETVFNFTKLDAVYKLAITNNLPIFYSEVNRYKFFVTKKKEGEFDHEDCGDFDG